MVKACITKFTLYLIIRLIEDSLVIVVLYLERLLIARELNSQKGKRPLILIKELRHTFVSHFMMNGGDILTLQKVLGHSDLKMTLRYSHLSPDYLTKVLELNPLINCKIPERAKVVGLFDGLSM